MFKKAHKNVAHTDANAVSPKTDTQASEDSEEHKQPVLTSARLSNQFVQLPPYVYVPSRHDEASPVSPHAAQQQGRGKQEHPARNANIDVLMPQEAFLRRSGYHQFLPAQHLYHYPDERMLQHLQPQYIVVSPTFASRPMFSRPFDGSMQPSNVAWLQQQQHLQSATLHAPELNSMGMTPPRVDTTREKQDTPPIVPVDIVEKDAPKPTANVSPNKEPESPRVVVGEKPKRPLSAYNYFFKEEREKMVRIETGGDKRNKKNKRHGIKFEDMAKSIAKKWNDIGPEALEKFEVMAQTDKERYKVAMNEYNQRKNAALSAVHKELASTVSKEKMQQYLKNQRGMEQETKGKTT